MLGWVVLEADEIVQVKGRFELQRVHCITNLNPAKNLGDTISGFQKKGKETTMKGYT